MTKSAQVILTGYDKPKMNKSIVMMKKYFKTINVKIIEDGTTVKAKSKLWGCEEGNIEQEVISLSGTMDNLQKILYAKPTDGIYLQLLLK